MEDLGIYAVLAMQAHPITGGTIDVMSAVLAGTVAWTKPSGVRLPTPKRLSWPRPQPDRTSMPMSRWMPVATMPLELRKNTKAPRGPLSF
jgi:hypothetical protein